jgi:hypothetical protein
MRSAFLNTLQAIKKKWLEFNQQDAVSDTDPLSDVEYDDQPGESDAGGGTPGGSLVPAVRSAHRSTPHHQRDRRSR